MHVLCILLVMTNCQSKYLNNPQQERSVGEIHKSENIHYLRIPVT